jgi:hypothetical protein
VPAIANLYRASVQPYLISWFQYDPSAEIARLTMPALILQGTTDIQVPVADAEALGRAKPGARVEIIDGMNHVLKEIREPAAQLPSYSNPALPIVPRLAEVTTAFVRGLDAPGTVQPRRPPGQRLSPRATVVAAVGGAHIGIEYGQPSKRGRQIWGALVPWGRWWMPGADEATTLTTSHTLQFGSLTVPAGDYTIYTQPSAQEFSLLLNREVNVFHTVYRAASDLGRVPMQATAAEGAPIERLTFRVGATDRGGFLALVWDDRSYRADFTVSR